MSQPIKDYGYKDKEKVLYNGFWRRFKLEKNFPEITGRKIVAYFNFDTANNSELVVKVALSAVSTEGAIKNLHAEASGKSFEQLAEAARTDWNSELEHFEIEGTPDQKAMFYTSLYHTMINPSVYMDVDGSYRGLDHNIHRAEGFTNYTIFSLWDTYRAEHPFLNLVKPGRNADMVESMIKHEQQSVHGMLPIWSLMGNENWCMSGYHAVSVLADAITKGVFSNVDEALAAMVSTSTVPYYEGIADYMKLGYIPLDKSGTAASSTLEYAYDDWCIYKLAKELKRPKKEINLFAKRAMNYKNLFDKESKLMRGRNEDGTFQSPFSPLKWGDAFTEGNSWHYTWSVFHDPQGLIDLMGGKEMFVTMMDSVFAVPPVFDDSYYGQVIHEIREMTVMNMGNYAHGNQPIQHMIYLYDYAGQPWKAQYWLRQVMDCMYSPTPDGYCGDEDNGQTSAWYVFSALGFYPVCPGTDEYIVGAPLFKKATLHFENGNSLVIDAPNNSKKNFYVNSMNVNGTDYTKNYLRHEELFKGGIIKVDMSNQPNMNRGTKEEDMPYSFSKEQ